MNSGLQFISLTWSDRVPDNEAIMIVRDVHVALRQAHKFLPETPPLVMLPEIKPFGFWVLSGADPDQPYCSTQWYIEYCLNADKSGMAAGRYLNLVMNEPYQYQTPHYDIAIMHHPLFDEKTGREVIGMAVDGRVALFSTASLKHLGRDHDRPVVLRRLVAHHLGRAIGIPFPIHMEHGRCYGPCAMRPAAGVEEWRRLADEEDRADVIYCDTCRRQLGARLASNQLGMN